MGTSSIILAAGIAVGMGMLFYKVANRRKIVHPPKFPQPEKKPPTPQPKVKTLPPEFSDSEINTIINLMTKLDAIYKKM